MENQNQSKQTMSEAEKKQKAELKAKRKAEFEAKFKKEIDAKKTEKSNKSKAELKAERRAIQESQRAAKSGSSIDPTKQQQPQKSNTTKTEDQKPINNIETKISKLPKKNANIVDHHKESKNLEKQDSIISNNELQMKIFAHLPRRVSDINMLTMDTIPPIIIKIGYQMNKDIIEDPTARCVAMLIAFQQIIEQYKPLTDLKLELHKILIDDCQFFLNKCRPLSISMSNAIKHMNMLFSRISSSSLNDDEFREKICSSIDTFIDEEIMCSRTAISGEYALKIFSINSNQTILTLGFSTIMQKIFLKAIEANIKFNVIIVDTSPRFDGRKMVKFLTKHGIPTTYVLINAILYVMKKVNKVMLEAHSVLCNGYVMSTVGSSQLALVAEAYNVPVIVCCETYKYSDHAYTDCFLQNELGADSTESFFSNSSKNSNLYKTDKRISSNLNFLDLFYDLIPRELVSAVITEKGFLPCTSVPAILRSRETIR